MIKFDSNSHSVNKIEYIFYHEQHFEGHSKNTISKVHDIQSQEWLVSYVLQNLTISAQSCSVECLAIPLSRYYQSMKNITVRTE